MNEKTKNKINRYFTASSLKNIVIKGIEKAWLNQFNMSNNIHCSLKKPEYLTTISLCLTFSDWLKEINLNEDLFIEAEYLTKELWSHINKNNLYNGNNKSINILEDFRDGQVDIVILKKQIANIPLVIIENKGHLKFLKGTNILYKISYKELEKDIKRNLDFLSGTTNLIQQVKYTAFTFYLDDINSTTKNEGKKYCKNKKKYFEKLIKNLNIKNINSFCVDVDVATLNDDLYMNAKDGNKTDEVGCPAYVDNPPNHLVYGIISIYRKSV